MVEISVSHATAIPCGFWFRACFAWVEADCGAVLAGRTFRRRTSTCFTRSRRRRVIGASGGDPTGRHPTSGWWSPFSVTSSDRIPPRGSRCRNEECLARARAAAPSDPGPRCIRRESAGTELPILAGNFERCRPGSCACLPTLADRSSPRPAGCTRGDRRFGLRLGMWPSQKAAAIIRAASIAAGERNQKSATRR